MRYYAVNRAGNIRRFPLKILHLASFSDVMTADEIGPDSTGSGPALVLKYLGSYCLGYQPGHLERKL